VYVYYLKGIVSVCFRCPARTVGFSGTCLYLYRRLEGNEFHRPTLKGMGMGIVWFNSPIDTF